MQYLVFDTETTGLPLNYKAPLSDLGNWPRVIQLGWAFYDEFGNVLEKTCDLIKPDGWEVPTGEFWANNGFSQEKSMAEGIPVRLALAKFINKLVITDLLIAHNMNFDYPIVAAEMMRANVRSDRKVRKFCTMESTVEFCKIVGLNGYKWPKLEYLHKELFGIGFEGAHDAMNDVLACGRCFFELRKRGIIYA